VTRLETKVQKAIREGCGLLGAKVGVGLGVVVMIPKSDAAPTLADGITAAAIADGLRVRKVQYEQPAGDDREDDPNGPMLLVTE